MPKIRIQDERLTRAAAAHGDHTNYAIAKRTGLSQDTVGRLRKGAAAPSATSLVTLAQTYGIPMEELVENQTAEVAAPVKDPA
ncbi:helix-turn-helix domain-containing protein [Streptomyces sp. NBC_01477]|uniref:helix-turn-helix domain-containing protein n=1 Tax=Streptomyces sp. NBC_01477 TaxID=2976015 RepID=UPI002E349010|nr:helix-turn-helix transcriptional regulator [Streptomyces sp. NBC_01477]